MGRLRRSCSVLRSPVLLIRSRLILKTGFGPTSSAVGMFEPVTMMRSVTASPPAWPAAGGTAAVWSTGAGGGGGACAKALAAKRKGIPTLTARAEQRNPNLVSTVLVISFSMVWLGLTEALKKILRSDKT